MTHNGRTTSIDRDGIQGYPTLPSKSRTYRW